MRILGIFRNGHRPDEHWRMVALQMAQDAAYGSVGPPSGQMVMERAEKYLKFIRTGKAYQPL